MPDGFEVVRHRTPAARPADFLAAHMQDALSYERVFIPFGNPRERLFDVLRRHQERDRRKIRAVLVGWRLYFQLDWDHNTMSRLGRGSIDTPAGRVALFVTEDYPDVCQVIQGGGFPVRPGREVRFEDTEELTATITREDVNG